MTVKAQSVPAQAARGSGGFVLVIDDDAVSRSRTAERLTRLGFYVDEAEDMAAAMAHLMRRRYAAVLVELYLDDPAVGEGAALALARATGIERRNTPLIAVIEDVRAGADWALRGAGFSGVLPRRFAGSELMAILDFPGLSAPEASAVGAQSPRPNS